MTSTPNTVVATCRLCGLDEDHVVRKGKVINPCIPCRQTYSLTSNHRSRVRSVGGPQSPDGIAFIQWVAVTDEALDCHYCGTRLTREYGPRKATVDHLNGIAEGNLLPNLQTSCMSCNISKWTTPYDIFVEVLGNSFANDRRSKRRFLRTLQVNHDDTGISLKIA
jgi:5-methylcytosine-specific restriction endonuclease McrA